MTFIRVLFILTSMKYCPKCQTPKVFSDFYKRKTGPKTGKYYEKCKECMKKRGRSYYYQNRAHLRELVTIRRRRIYAENRKFVIEYKNRPCQDCGQNFPSYVMDLDHRDRSEKRGDVAHLISSNWSLAKIKEEVKKM